MIQRQTERYGFEEPARTPGSMALYAWASIAALSALTACLTFLVPFSDEPVSLVKRPGFAVGEPVKVARKPDIVAPKDVTKTLIVKNKIPAVNNDAEVARLIEKYRETSDPVDPQTTATTEIQANVVVSEPLRPTQAFPDEDAVGATIGISDSIPALVQRYTALQRRAPDLFDSIDPLVELVEGGERLEARLVAGPFSQQAELAEFCRAIKLRMTIDCSAGEYSGEPLEQ